MSKQIQKRLNEIHPNKVEVKSDANVVNKDRNLLELSALFVLGFDVDNNGIHTLSQKGFNTCKTQLQKTVLVLH